MFERSVGKCRFSIHFSFFALLAFCNLFAGIKDGGVIIASVALHETAHLLAMIHFGQTPKAVLVSALGMRIEVSKSQRLDYRKSMGISLAGPLSNIILSLSAGIVLWLCRYFISMPPQMLMSILQTFFGVNLTLGLVHLLPIEPLDGGLALRAFLSRFLEAGVAKKVTTVISVVLLLPMAFLGFCVLLQTRYNFSLLALSIYLMLYILLKEDYSI